MEFIKYDTIRGFTGAKKQRWQWRKPVEGCFPVNLYRKMERISKWVGRTAYKNTILGEII